MSGKEFINAIKEKQANEVAEKEKKKIRAQECIEKKLKTEENKRLKRGEMAKRRKECELEKSEITRGKENLKKTKNGRG